MAQRYQMSGVFASLDAALAESWDAAVVATPAHTHIPIARRLTDENIPTLVEKPLATSLAGVPELLAAVAAKQLVTKVGYTYRSHPGLAAMKQALDSGRFGTPLQLYLVGGQPFARFRPAYRETYFTAHEHGGGAIQDALTHFIDLGHWFVGPVDRIVADADHKALAGVAVEDTVHVIVRHGALLGCYCLNMYQAPNELTLTLVCTRGTVRFELHKQRWRWMTELDGPWHDETFAIRERDDWFKAQENAYLDALEGKPTSLCTLAEAAHALRVNLAAFTSLAQRCWQSVGD
jgi:predicted dehydrogenase